jgi:hypothetical protein
VVPDRKKYHLVAWSKVCRKQARSDLPEHPFQTFSRALPSILQPRVPLELQQNTKDQAVFSQGNRSLFLLALARVPPRKEWNDYTKEASSLRAFLLGCKKPSSSTRQFNQRTCPVAVAIEESNP